MLSPLPLGMLKIVVRGDSLTVAFPTVIAAVTLLQITGKPTAGAPINVILPGEVLTIFSSSNHLFPKAKHLSRLVWGLRGKFPVTTLKDHVF